MAIQDDFNKYGITLFKRDDGKYLISESGSQGIRGRAGEISETDAQKLTSQGAKAYEYSRNMTAQQIQQTTGRHFGNSSGSISVPDLVSKYQAQEANLQLEASNAANTAAKQAWEVANRGTRGIVEPPKGLYENDAYVMKDGVFTTRKSLSEDEMHKAAVAAGTEREIKIGNGIGYMPTGTAGDDLQRQIDTGTAPNVNNPANQAVNLNQPVSPTGVQQGTQYNLGNVNLSVGSKDKNAVMQLQTALNAAGANIRIDGLFGPATKAAVEAYQREKGLRVDGIVGQQTRGALSGQQVGLDPVTQAFDDSISNDPQKQSQYDSLPPELKSLLDTLRLQISTSLEKGDRVNPDLEITPEMTAGFVEEATKELDPYFQEIIKQNKQDITTSFRQLQEDYTKQIQREQPAFQQTLENQDVTEANQGTAFSSGRNKREGDIITGQQQQLDDYFTANQRNAQELATKGERQVGSRAFSDLGIPSLQSYSANRGNIAPRGQLTSTGSRSLYSPEGGLFGNIPSQAKTAINTRASELEEQERKSRLLDYSSKLGLGSTSLG